MVKRQEHKERQECLNQKAPPRSSNTIFLTHNWGSWDLTISKVAPRRTGIQVCVTFHQNKEEKRICEKEGNKHRTVSGLQESSWGRLLTTLCAFSSAYLWQTHSPSPKRHLLPSNLPRAPVLPGQQAVSRPRKWNRVCATPTHPGTHSCGTDRQFQQAWHQKQRGWKLLGETVFRQASAGVGTACSCPLPPSCLGKRWDATTEAAVLWPGGRTETRNRRLRTWWRALRSRRIARNLLLLKFPEVFWNTQ